MFVETEKRIRDGLLASLEGGSLKWLQGYQVPNPLLHNNNTEEDGEHSTATSPAAPSTVSAEKAPQPTTPGSPNAKSNVSAPKSGEKAGSRPSTQKHAAPVIAPAALVDLRKYDFKHAMGFLREGFEELVKCRCVSRFKLASARCAHCLENCRCVRRFSNGPTLTLTSSSRMRTTATIPGKDLTGTCTVIPTLPRCLYCGHRASSQRRTRYDRSSGHRPSFDLLQGELETLVETLSGACRSIRVCAYS
jgi:hypothetical protein